MSAKVNPLTPGMRSSGGTAFAGSGGFIATTLVVLIVTLTTLALLGPYEVLMADWIASQPASPCPQPLEV